MQPPDNTNVQSSHAEFLLACERVAHIWKERAEGEAALWTDFKAMLTTARDFDEALQLYVDFSRRRMQMASHDMRRLFEEYQDVTGRFPAGKTKLCPNSLFV